MKGGFREAGLEIDKVFRKVFFFSYFICFLINSNFFWVCGWKADLKGAMTSGFEILESYQLSNDVMMLPEVNNFFPHRRIYTYSRFGSVNQ